MLTNAPVCHFSGKPSTTRLSVAKYLFLTRFWDPLTLAPTGVDLRFTSVQDEQIHKNTNCGSTAILLLKKKWRPDGRHYLYDGLSIT